MEKIHQMNYAKMSAIILFLRNESIENVSDAFIL